MNILSNFNKQEFYLLIYLLVINVFSFILFAIDKRKAEKRKWRISENILLFASLMGGATGSLIAMVIFKHKLSKKTFYIGLPILIVLNRIAVIWIFNFIK